MVGLPHGALVPLVEDKILILTPCGMVLKTADTGKVNYFFGVD